MVWYNGSCVLNITYVSTVYLLHSVVLYVDMIVCNVLLGYEHQELISPVQLYIQSKQSICKENTFQVVWFQMVWTSESNWIWKCANIFNEININVYISICNIHTYYMRCSSCQNWLRETRNQEHLEKAYFRVTWSFESCLFDIMCEYCRFEHVVRATQ